MKEDREIEGFAVWLFSGRAAPEDPPILRGIFDSIDEAKAALSVEGIISEVQSHEGCEACNRPGIVGGSGA